jgi:hypothetical protein
MRRTLIRCIVVWVGSLLAGCDALGPSKPSTKSISSEAIAEAAFQFLKSACTTVESAVPVRFTAPYAVSGASGSASVTGTKTASSTSSSSSVSSTSTSDLTIAFTAFGMKDVKGSVAGTVRWYEYHYSRTACSSSTCASSSDNSEAAEGTSVKVTFEYSNATYTDTITVDASSPEYTSRWDVKITTSAGKVYSFTAY